MNVAVLGAGRIGAVHARLLAGDDRVAELIIADVDTARAGGLARELGARTAPDTASAIAAADAVVIAASTDSHAGLVRAAVDRGIPAFCEKPLALDLSETIDLVRHVERARATVQVGFQRRFDPEYLAARQLVVDGAFGTVYLVRLIAHDHEPPPDAYVPVSGGLFKDSSIHDFDALRWVTGTEVEEVYAEGSAQGFPVLARHGDVGTAVVTLRLADGTLGVLSQTRQDALGYDIRMEVVGSRDSVAVGLGPQTPIRPLGGPALAGPAWAGFMTRFEAAYRAELTTFVRVAAGEVESPCTAADAMEAMRICEAAGRSRAAHAPILLADVPSTSHD